MDIKQWFEMPTTPGSILTFDTWEDQTGTDEFRAIVTLVPGGIDVLTGEYTDSVWTDAYGADGLIYDVNEEAILAGNPEILFEAPHPVDNAFSGFHASDETPFGTIVLLDSPNYGENSIAVYAPGSIDENDCVEEGAWTNAYGAIFTHEDINAYGLFVLVYGRNKIKRLG